LLAREEDRGLQVPTAIALRWSGAADDADLHPDIRHRRRRGEHGAAR